MILTTVKTHPITSEDNDILALIERYITELQEGSVLVITSKILAITEWALIPVEWTEKVSLIQSESDEYLDVPNPYGVVLTIKNNTLIASAGIDESNGDHHFILWPRDPQASANRIRAYLAEKFQLKNVGVIITDSVTRPLRWWVTGISIAHSGFQSLHDYRGEPDIFGRHLHFTQSNIADGLAAASVLVMWEGNECTPFAVISDIDFVSFTWRDPTEEELLSTRITREEDIYGALLENESWKKGEEQEQEQEQVVMQEQE